MDATRLLSVPASPAAFAALVGYAAAAVAFLVSAWLARDPQAQRRAAVVYRWAQWAFVTAVLAHAIDIGWRGTLRVHPAQSSREALGFAAWLATLGFAAGARKYRLEVTGVVVALLAGVLLGLARWTPEGTGVGQLPLYARLHVSLATLAVALFGLAGLAAALYRREARRLKSKVISELAAPSSGASLLALERLSRRLLAAGMVIMTPALALGVAWQLERGASGLRPESLLAWGAWSVGLATLASRRGGYYRPRRDAWLTVCAAVLSLGILVIYVVQRAWP